MYVVHGDVASIYCTFNDGNTANGLIYSLLYTIVAAPEKKSIVCSYVVSSYFLQHDTHTEGLPFRNSFDFILTPTPHMLIIGRKLLISRVYKTQHA
jgi:hypothetical protein